MFVFLFQKRFARLQSHSSNSLSIDRQLSPSRQQQVDCGNVWLPHIVVVVLVIWAAATIFEPLWIDELHTLWVISGSWGNVLSRASSGNQSPLYFWILKLWTSGFDSCLVAMELGFSPAIEKTLCIRSFSLLGWIVLLTMMVRTIRLVPNNQRNIVLLIGGLWLATDRIGGYYATEARPYVWVAVAGWGILTSIPKPSSAFGILSCFIAFYFHYTAILLIIAAWSIRVCVQVSHRSTLKTLAEPTHFVCKRSLALRLSIETAVLGILLLPGLYHLFLISQKSSQWASFAGATDTMSLLRVLPWFAWVIIPSVAIWIKLLWKERKGLGDSYPHKSKETLTQTEGFSLEFISSILAGLCLTACFVLTFFNYFPLVHSRYLFGLYSVIWIAGTKFLSRLWQVRQICCVGLIALAMNGWLQGSWSLWSRGEFIAWQRNEPWESAIAFLDEHVGPSDLLLLAPMLVETEEYEVTQSLLPLEAQLSVDGEKRNYLAFALRALPSRIQSLPVEILCNHIDQWESTIASTIKDRKIASKNIWVVARTTQPWIFNETSEHPWKVHDVFFSGNLRVWKIH